MAEANFEVELDPPVSGRYEPWETRRYRVPEGTEVEPLRNDVLLEPLKQEGGRIIIPEAAAADLPQALAKVLAVGSGETRFDGGRVPLELEVGDIVVYVPGRAVPVKYGGRRVLLTTERHILCVYHGDPAEFGKGPTGDIGGAVLPRDQPSPTDAIPRPQPVTGRPKIVAP